MTEDLYNGPAVLAPLQVDRSAVLGRWVVGPLAILLLSVVLVFYVLFSAHVVKGDSMNPTLLDGDRLLATHGYRTPNRGDIVVFTIRDDRNGANERLIKRVAAIEGDTIEVRDGLALVNGVAEDPRGRLIDPADPAETESYVVPPGTVFVLGDFRAISVDSRQLGPIPLSSIRGRVEWLWLPLDRFRRLSPLG